MAGKICLKRAAVIIFSSIIVLIMGACMEPVDFEAYMDDSKVQGLLDNNKVIVNIPGITGVTAPVTGATPVTSIANAQYTGTVSWATTTGGVPHTGPFAASTSYTATITLTATSGFTLTGVTQNFFTVTGATPVTNPANSGVVTAVFPATGAPTPINGQAIVGVTTPATGATDTTAITDTKFTGAVSSWSPTLTGGIFAASTPYTATITLTAGGAYTFTGSTGAFTVNTYPATIVTNAGTTMTLSVVFPATGAAPPTIINGQAITSVTVPTTGVTDATAITDTKFTGAVVWSPTLTGGIFAASTSYTATITLTAGGTYTFTGSTGAFTVTGASAPATVTANTGATIELSVAFPQTAAIIINGQAIASVTVPVNGATDATAITDTKFTGAVSWSPTLTGGIFASSTTYTATILLTAGSGYTFTGSTGAFTVAGSTSANASLNTGTMITITAVFPQTTASDTIIVGHAIVGVTSPVTGATPLTPTITGTGYTGAISWDGSPSAFVSGTVHEATITLSAISGYTFTGTTGAFTVNTNPATVVTNTGTVITLSVTFPKTDTTISIKPIPGVTAPETGKAPVFEITETAEYTGSITWTPTIAQAGGLAASNTVYTANITLIPKATYTLTGVTQNFFTVTGAVATNSANSGVVSAVFPVTDTTVTTLAITGITAPVAGDTPYTTPISVAQYTGTITWSPTLPASGKFAPGTAYSAVIDLAKESGYTFTGVGAFTVAGATVTPSLNTGTTIRLTALFPATAATINIYTIGVARPIINATAVTTITPTAQFTGTVAWSPALVGGTTFAASTVYTATITLIPETDFTTEGLGVNAFTVASANPVTNSADSGVITAVFPATAAVAVDGIEFTISFNISDPVHIQSTGNASSYNDIVDDGEALSFTLTGGSFGNIKWYFEGQNIAGSDGATSFTIDKTTNAVLLDKLTSGKHNLTVTGLLNGSPYSAEVIITITNGDNK
jgi:hypothetical protein